MRQGYNLLPGVKMSGVSHRSDVKSPLLIFSVAMLLLRSERNKNAFCRNDFPAASFEIKSFCELC